MSALLVSGGTVPVRADGDDYFVTELFNPDGTPIVQGGYLGAVKDDQGGYIQDATIKIAITVDTGQGPHPLAFNAYTNSLGRYRSLDPKGVIADFLAIDVEVDPRNVEVTVMKDGYEMVRRFVRGRSGGAKGGPIEIDFVLKKKSG